MRKVYAMLLSLLLTLALCAAACAEAEPEPFQFQGTQWGMTNEAVQELLQAEPFQAQTAPTGHTMLAYRFRMNGFPCIVQFNFLPEDALYNIEIMAPDAEKAFYQSLAEDFTDLYGEPLTEEEASLEADDAAAVMMAALIQSTQDSDYLGWMADEETVIVLSFGVAYKVTYVEIRRYTDYFRFE